MRRNEENTMTRQISIFVLLIAVVVCQAMPVVAGVTRRYVEDFTTTHYKDPLNTTAMWDTIAAEIKLDRYYISQVGGYNTPGIPRGVAVAGDHVYVADGTTGLLAISIANPLAPTLSDSHNTPGQAMKVALAGNLAYVADLTGGLQIIDITDPSFLSTEGSYDTGGSAYDVALDGDYAYLADQAGDLVVFDVSDPSAPDSIAAYTGSFIVLAVDVDGEYLYLGEGSTGVEILDVSDPTSPTLIGSYATGGYSYELAADGAYLYVADWENGVVVLDVSDRTNPVQVDRYDTSGWAAGVTTDGDFLYVSDAAPGVQVFDISDPANLVLVDSYDTGSAYDVAVAGQHAFVADWSYGLVVLDIAQPVSGALAGGYGSVPERHNAMAIAGDYAYAVGLDQSLDGLFRVIDIADPTAPTVVSTLGGDTYGKEDIVVAGDYAYVASGYDGLQIIDISDPITPTLTGSYITAGAAEGIAVAGDYVYVVEYGGDDLDIFDVTNPAAPTRVGVYNTTGQAYGIALEGNLAYVAFGSSSMKVIDVSNPAAPVEIGSGASSAHHVAIAGDWAYIGRSSSSIWEFRAIDISDPTTPAIVSSLDLAALTGIAAAGDNVYTVSNNGIYFRIDVSDPANPALVDSIVTGFNTAGLEVCGDYLFQLGSLPNFQTRKIWERWFDVDQNVARSLSIDESDYDVERIRVTTAQTGSVDWELSADGGTNWTVAVPGSWQEMDVPGDDLSWRSTHVAVRSGENPSCSNLDVEWLYAVPVVDSIRDVAGDEGHQVRVSWTRSSHDFVGDATPIYQYVVYRRIDASGSGGPAAAAAWDDLPLAPAGDVDPKLQRVYPPGEWDYVATVPADAQHRYAAVVPTLLDSSITQGTRYTTFFISAFTATPGVYFDSPPDSGYSVDNLAPPVPLNFAVAYNTGAGNTLSWDDSEAADFDYFNVYRSSDPKFTPGPGTLVHATSAVVWSDPEYNGWPVHYKVTAVDFSGNESNPTGPGTVTAVAGDVAPKQTALFQNVPNPFNPSTTIRYNLAQTGRVELRVYSARGALVRTLVDGVEASGAKSAKWNGLDARGVRVASGVYFYRLETPGFTNTLKMVLVE